MQTHAVRSLVVLAVLMAFAVCAGPAAATIGQTQWTLNVNKSGPGYVSGSGTGWSIDCGTQCSDTVDNDCAFDADIGQVVCETVAATVTAAGQNGYTLQSWSGCDQVNGADCTVSATNSATVTATFQDAQPPTVSLTSPSSSQIKSGTFTIAATASDNNTVASVRFYVRGAQVGSDSTAPFSMTFDSTTVTDGSALVEARAFDPAGYQSSLSGATVTIDNHGPNLSDIAGPGVGPFGPGTTQSFNWTVNDSPGSGLSGVQCKLDDGGFGACASSTTASFSDLPHGAHTLTVKAADNAGHTTEKSYAWSIDAVAPVAQFTSGPADGSSSADTSAAFTFSADEPATFQCRFHAAADTPPAFTPCMNPDSFQIAGLSPGTYVVEVMPVDGVGNTGAAIKRTFTVTAPPTSTSTGGDGSGSPAPSDGSPASGSPSGGVAAIAAVLSAKWSVKAGKTRARLLKLTKLPAAAAIKVACKSKKKGCPFKSKTFKPKAGSLDLTKAFKRTPLAAGTKITITISAAGMTGQQILLTTQKKKPPKRS